MLDAKDGRVLKQLGRQVQKWRRTHHARAPYPPELWARAVELAGRLGVRDVAHATGLDAGLLKKRLAVQRAVEPKGLEPAPPAFIEWLAPLTEQAGPSNITACALEVESPRGSRLRVELKGVSPSDLSTILREFAA